MTSKNKEIPPLEREDLLATLEERFNKNMRRHEGLEWANVLARLKSNPDTLWSINEMEKTGGEPDVIGFDAATGEFVFCDCSPESPKGRRSVCYDQAALDSRKEHKPKDSAMNMAKAMGVDVLDEPQYFELQKLGSFDLKTSSWLATPDEVRSRGGAIFGDCRFGRVFIYHNGAESYYGARGFRGRLKV